MTVSSNATTTVQNSSINDDVVGGFTVVRNKSKVILDNAGEILPFWITNPTVFDPELSLNPLDSITELYTSLRERLISMGYTSLFPVQLCAIPWILNSYRMGSKRPVCRPRDACIAAPTGSGKTLAYAIPIVQLLLNRKHKFIRAVVILPVRDLAVQVYNIFKTLSADDLEVALLCGKWSLQKEREYLIDSNADQLQCKVDIVVATPGRLVDHIYNTPGFRLDRLRILVIDEADRVLAEEKQDWYRILEEAMYHPITFAYNAELQFNHDYILHPKLRKPPVMTIAHQYDTSHDITLQKILVSATLTHDPGPLKRFNLYFPHLFAPKQVTRDRNIKRVSDEAKSLSEIYDPAGDSMDQPTASAEGVSAGVGQFTTPIGLKEFIVCAKPSQRVLFLLHLIRHRKVKNILCFTNSRNEADRLGVVLSNFRELSVSTISSGMPVDKRQRILNSFVSGNITILICTDAMARGMDIADVYCVVNYEMPSSVKTYVHRVGRTARAGKAGLAYTLLDRNQFFHFKRDLRNVGKGKIKELPFHGSQTTEFQEEYKKAIKALKSSVLKTSQSLHLRTVSQLASHKGTSSATATATATAASPPPVKKKKKRDDS